MPEAPIYRTLQATFIAPTLIPEGKLIEFDGEPGPHLEPQNEAAKAMMEAYYKAKPEANINPVQALPLTVGAAANPTHRVVGDAPPEEVISFVDMATRAGIANEPARVTSLAEAENLSRTELNIRAKDE